eukprot:gnl/MRDRNA2_/MRDRNA2_89732_c0_seq1.p1 gnl/MRDRNA2_/MRDRNA2_89732_c0~~gnl/MRDRNA2_/MRDRNA2_89732_c0_seq1.p1  ORF type:complete len:762 (+),score=201.19 gnl/MRDRNA2_/MRDRNA2_89732_c0_seq1:130-2415(+)
MAQSWSLSTSIVFLFLLVGSSVADEYDENEVCSQESEDRSSSGGCLLQNTLATDIGNSLAESNVKKPSRRSMALFEIESSVDTRSNLDSDSSMDLAVNLQEQLMSSVDLQSRMKTLTAMRQTAEYRCKGYQAHSFLMGRTTNGLTDSLASLMVSLEEARPRAKRHLKKQHAKTTMVPAHAVENLIHSVDADAPEAASDTAPDTSPIEESRIANAQQDTSSTPAKAAASSEVPSASNEGTDSVALPGLSQKADQAPKKDEETEGKTPDENKTKTFQEDSLSKLVDQFIESQSGSEDACHSKLLEARHQLNQLYDVLSLLLTQVNSTENALILYDKELQDKLKELTEIEAWRDEELEKCKKKKEEAEKMYIQLTAELKEMHQIASPATAMNITGGTVSEQASKQESLSLIQTVAVNPESASQEDVVQQKQGVTIEDLKQIPGLVQSTHSAAADFHRCMNPETQAALLQQDPKKKVVKPKAPDSLKKDETYETSQGTAASDEKCKEEKEKLEKTFVKAYIELSRLKAEYEAIVKSTACEDTVISQYEERAPPLQEAAEELAKLSSETAAKLKELKPRLESAIEADKKLRKQVADLNQECQDLPDTISDLAKVRDAIRALSLCPGLYRPEFKMPKWAGKWADFAQDSKKQSDQQQDAAMNWACNNAFKGSRAAEAAEIQERTILDVPINNTADVPLMGICPNCAGEDDKDSVSKHTRRCWFRGQPLNDQGVTGNCGEGKKAILCVVDQTNMRTIAGEEAEESFSL